LTSETESDPDASVHAMTDRMTNNEPNAVLLGIGMLSVKSMRGARESYALQPKARERIILSGRHSPKSGRSYSAYLIDISSHCSSISKVLYMVSTLASKVCTFIPGFSNAFLIESDDRLTLTDASQKMILTSKPSLAGNTFDWGRFQRSGRHRRWSYI